MAWPTPQEYNEAVQSPAFCFQDLDLKKGTVQTDRLGLPRPIAGGFAVVYRVSSGNKTYAVRCFLSEVRDLRERYTCIEATLRSSSLPYFVSFAFLESGIRVGGKWYPILKMEWTEGETLIDYIRRNLSNPAQLQSLARNWQSLCSALFSAGLAHGDLQHGNVLLRSGQLVLIDYDGMFVPSLRGKTSSELGHRHYQHPQRRSNHFDSWLDGFAGWIIFASIVAFSIDQRLWDQAKAGDESLLLRKEDFDNPAASTILGLLKKHTDPRLRQLGEVLQTLFALPPQQITFADMARLDFGITKALPGDGSWLDDIVQKAPKGPIKANSRENPSEESPVPLPSIPEWMERPVSQIPTVSFGLVHREERFVLVIVWSGALIPALLNGSAGVALSLLLMPTVYLGWWLWVRSRFESHPLTVERRTAESRLPNEIILRNTAKEMRAEWSKAKRLFGSRKQALESLDSRVNEERKGAETNQTQEMSLARSRFVESIEMLGRKEAGIGEQEKEAIGRITLRYQTDTAQLTQDLANHRSGREADKTQAWLTARSTRSELTSLAAKYSAKSSTEGATLQNEENGLLADLKALSFSRHTELGTSLLDLQRQHIDSFLARYPIAGATIEGIGPVLQERLAAHGFHTAKDLTTRNVYGGQYGVPGIGTQKQGALRAWRDRVHANADRTKPAGLPNHVEQPIRQKYRAKEEDISLRLREAQRKRNSLNARLASEEKSERESLQARLVKEEEQARNAEIAIERKYADRETTLLAQIKFQETRRDSDHQLIRSDHAAQREGLVAERARGEKEFNVKVAEITQRFAREFSRIAEVRVREEEEVTASIQQSLNELTAISAKVAKVEQEAADVAKKLSKYSGVTLRAYLAEGLNLKR